MKKKERPEYEALVERIASGELTRKQAAALSTEATVSPANPKGLSAATFLVWLCSSGASERLKGVHGNSGANSPHALVHTNPDKAKAYDLALAEALSGKNTLKSLAAKYDISEGYLGHKVYRHKRLHKTVVPPDEAHEFMQALMDDPVRVAAAYGAIKALGL